MHFRSALARALAPLRRLLLLAFAIALIAPTSLLAANPAAAPPRVDSPILGAPSVPEQAPLGYATGPDRTLIRWICTDACPAQFDVQRKVNGGPFQRVATVGRVSDPDAAIKILNSTDARWPDLYKELLEAYRDVPVTDVAGLYAMLDQNPLVAQSLANEHYPVALINGWGFLDTAITPGATYEYRVSRVSDNVVLGSVKLVAGQLTPLAAPTGLRAVNLDPASSALTHAKGADWGSVQTDRRFHQGAYLHWDVGAPTARAYPAAWTIGYDIFRAPRNASNALVQVNGATAVQPIPAALPDLAPSALSLAGAAKADYQLVEHYYADRTEQPGAFIYRVAPRDALGQVRQWPADAQQFSAGVPVETFDFHPPPPPQRLQAAVNAAHTQVALSWTMPAPPADLAGFRVEQTLAFNSVAPAENCADMTSCWVEVASVGPDILGWTDTSPGLEQARWYRVQAVDSAGNRSMPTMPVHATLHDVQPPGPPLLEARPCSQTPSDTSPDVCLEADGDADVARYLVGCTFESGGPELFLLEQAAVGGDLPALAVTGLYEPPFPLDDVPCTVRAVDAMGNISSPSAPAVVDAWASEEPPTLPAPILSEVVTTALDEDGNVSAEVRWAMPDSPLIKGFRIVRERVVDGGVETPVITGAGPHVRVFSGSDMRAGELYRFTVVAELLPGLGELSSEPVVYRALMAGRRPLVRFDLSSIFWNANNGTILNWNVCAPGAATQGDFRFAVFRSASLEQGYTQLTPIFPSQVCAASYTDASAAHGRYFYSVMQFDPRSGEPVGFSDPAQFDPSAGLVPGMNINVPQGQGLVQTTLYPINPQLAVPNCTPVNPRELDFTQPLIFGDGFEVHNLQVNLAGEAIAGSGDLRVFNGGKLVNIPVSFANITLGDAQNRVCTGALSVNVGFAFGSGLTVTPENGLPYQVLWLNVRPFFGNVSHGSGKVRVTLPPSMRAVNAQGDEADMLTFGGPELRIDAKLDFRFETNLSRIADHGCAAGEDPILAFSLETLPVVVVPTGTFRVTPAGVEAAGSCMDYAERYNSAAAVANPRPLPGNLAAGDSNDGFLRARYTGAADSLRITPAGLAGSFTTAAPLSYLASAPFGFSLELNGQKQLTLEASQIASGSLGAGSATFAYSRNPTEQPAQQVTVQFTDLVVDARGGLFAAVTPATASVEWLPPGGFVTGLLNSELYLAQVTSEQRPGQIVDGVASSALWAPRPGDTRDLGLEQPAGLEPGLNLRRDDHTLFWRGCAPGQLSVLPATVDAYIRHGGVSDRFRAQLDAPVEVDIHGYRTLVDAFDAAMLDSMVVDSGITGDLQLPFPADLDLRFLALELGLDGCVAGVDLQDETETLAYWGANVALTEAAFANEGPLPALPGYPTWKRVLRTVGAMELPHLAEPGRPAPATLEVGIGFQPDGNPYEAIDLVPDRPVYTLDGFPLLLNSLRLSTLNEAATWDDDATAAAPPTTNWTQRGFVEVQGAIAAPYFGLLVGEQGAPGDYPVIQMQLHEGYVGFAEQLKGARVWVDLELVQVVHEFRNLVYASSALENHGLLLGFRRYELIPDVGITALGLPDAAQLLHLDGTVVIEPADVRFFLGLSSGTAAFRAMAEAQDGQSPQLPEAVALERWADQLAMDEAQRNGYVALTAAIWPTYDTYAAPSYLSTTQVLSAFDEQPDQELPDSDAFGGGTMGAVELVGVEFNKLRGQVEVQGVGLGMQLEALEAALEVIVRQFDEPQPLLAIDTASLIITRYGEYIVEVVNGRSDLIGNQLALDATLVYNPATQQLEGGAGLHKDVDLLHRLEMWNISLNEATGAVGLGGDSLRYIGLNLEASWNFVPFRAGSFGGQVLVGTIDPDSPVLQNHFPDVLEHLHLVPAAPGADTSVETLKGGYVRLYGDVTQGDRRIAKVLTVNGGMRFGGWHWSNQADGSSYGALAGMFVHTNYLKVVSARGDITFTYAHTPEVDLLAAETWVAGGIGSCEPETWTSWESRWWNDKWCWSAGAQAELSYNLAADDFDASWDLDVEWP